MNHSQNKKVCGGLTLVETLIAIATLAILAGVAGSAFQGIQSGARKEKLKTDVMAINSAVRVYVASGGNLSNADSVDKVLSKLKSRASAERARRLTGLSSSLVDERLTYRLQTESEAAADEPRATWNAKDMLFEIAESGEPGIRGFHFSESAVPETDLIDEDRAGAMLFAKHSGWIWDHQDSQPDLPPGPTVIPLAAGTAPQVSPTPGLGSVSTPIGTKGVIPELPPHVASLLPPEIEFSSAKFDSETTSITVALSNSNPPGTGEIRYELVPAFGGSGPATPFATYTGAFSVNESTYPDGFGVRAYVRNILPEYESSPLVSQYAPSNREGGVFGGHLDLDTSTIIAEVGRGDTEAHTHDYTGKYDVTHVDFFNILDDKQIEVQEAVTDPAQRFKVTVVNGELSPGIRLSISFQDLDGTTATLVKAASDYDDYALDDLAVYSLGGVAGTRTLQSLQLQFNEDTILESSVIPTNTGDVKSNVLGKENEWRNGALTVQLVAVNPDGSDGFTTDLSLTAQGGSHGPASSGLLWEGALFWHWDGDSYHEKGNLYRPRDRRGIEHQFNDPGDWRGSAYYNDK
jgi:type II secretory pathway pseudopilin PulG